MKLNKYFLVAIFTLAILMFTCVNASDIVQDENATLVDQSDVLSATYYDDDFYVSVDENYTQDKESWDSNYIVYISSQSQRNGTFSILVDDANKLNIPLTNGYFSGEDDGSYNKYYECIYPGNLSLDCGNYNIKVNFNGNTLVDSDVNLKEKDDFDIYLLNPYYCEKEYWDSPSFIIIDSNHANTGTLGVLVNGVRKIAYNVINGSFEEIPDCSNKSRYIAPSDILDDYGTYNIKITFTENGKTQTLKDEQVIVAEFEPTVNPKLELGFNNYIQYLLDDNMAYIYLPREATGKLTISYNDHVFDVDYSKGYATHEIKSWNVQFLGETLFNVTYVGDDFGTLTTNGTIIVTPRVNGPAYVSQGEEFKFSMTTHNWVTGGKFDVYDYNNDVKGNLITSGVINSGLSTVSLSSNTLGLNKFYLEYDTLGSGKYYSIQEVQVVKNSENITVDVPSSVEEGSDVNITITAPALPYNFAYISIDDNAPNWYSMENGSIVKTFSNLDKGTHKISVQYNNGYYQDDNLVGDVYSNTFKVNVLGAVRIDAPDVTKYYKGPQRFVVYVHDKENNPIANAQVNITLNGLTYARTTDNDGKASMAINLESGVHDVITQCEGVKVDSKVTVKPTISGKDITKIYKNDTQYYATFIDTNGNPLKNTQVKFNINGVFYTRTTDASGVARLNINLNPGNYIITAENPNSTEKYSNNVNVLPSIVENHDLVKYYRNDSQYVIKVLGGDGKAVGAGVKVTFNINGVFYDRTTNASGHVKLNINLNPGKYIITAQYNGLMLSNNITIKPILEAKDLNMKYRDGSKFEAKLLDGKGNPFAGQKITFNINGIFYERTTGDDGIARLNINLMVGEYIITSMYENGATTSNKVTVKDYIL